MLLKNGSHSVSTEEDAAEEDAAEEDVAVSARFSLLLLLSMLVPVNWIV
jgi:hypothetical protein